MCLLSMIVQSLSNIGETQTSKLFVVLFLDFTPAISGNFVGHVPQCTKFTLMIAFLGQVKSRADGISHKR
eukprot:UN13561